jgi:hypothetical protein
MADPTLQYIISWVRSGAKNAKDPRLALFESLYKSSTIDPHTIRAKYTTPEKDKLTVQAKLSYIAPDIAALKKKKIVMKRGTKDIQVTLGGASPEATVFISFSRPMFGLTLEEVLLLCNLYILFKDERKLKLFQKLIQGENQ